MDKEYLTWSKSNTSKYKKVLKGSKYRVLKRADFFKKIVDDYRIHDFLCKDIYYQACLFDSKKEYYWLIDDKILFALLKLKKSLKNKGHDHDAFVLTSAYRHPRRNEMARGASLSRHIKGQALDLFIRDINRDGKYSKEDKDIVLEIAEKEVIKDNGGIGRYSGTRAVHIDVRGSKARWDSY